MALSWRALHAQLLERSRRASFRRRFNTLKTTEPELARFSGADALLNWLHDPGGTPEHKNEVLHVLVRAAQAADPADDTAQVLVLLALWPGCAAVYGRLRRHFRHEDDRLAAEITGRLSAMVAEMDLGRVNRIAATFLRNIERDIKRMLQREWSTGEDADIDAIGAETATDDLTGLNDLLHRLRMIVGVDAALVVAVAVMGFSQREAGLALGIGHDAARKRYQRALAKLRATGTTDVPL